MLSSKLLSDTSLQLLNNNEIQATLKHLKRGIEKEGLRVSKETGALAKSGHPYELGSALTNAWVTTDFSEALLEFITPVMATASEALDYLSSAHSLASTIMSDEVIWPASMPCALPSDNEIPLAQYGSSNLAKMKTAYRRGLGHRYGRAMQTVAGIHYNFSMPNEFWQAESNALEYSYSQEQINQRYLDLIRNFRRNFWLLIYLFGASPSADSTFTMGRGHQLNTSEHGDLFLPYATSLRMGDLGYQSIAQKSLFVCYNELATYIDTLSNAMHRPYPPYNLFGLEVDGEYQQLSTALLQIENEFYSAIRPKRVTNSNEKPLGALASRGIEYIEVRCLDLDPFSPVGISETEIDFLDVFLLACLISESPACNEMEFAEIGENQARVVSSGRSPDLELLQRCQAIKLRDAATDALSVCKEVAIVLDSVNQTTKYSSAVNAQQKKVDDPNLTPSALLLEELASTDSKFTDYIHELAIKYSNQQRQALSQSKHIDELRKEVEQSRLDQQTIESQDTLNFKEYIADYFSR
jgi:glutamate--cysteine ligase